MRCKLCASKSDARTDAERYICMILHTQYHAAYMKALCFRHFNHSRRVGLQLLGCLLTDPRIPWPQLFEVAQKFEPIDAT